MLGVLHYHIDIVILQQSVPEFDNMGVIHLQMQPDLTLDQFELRLRGHFFQVDLYNRSHTILRAYMRQVRLCLASRTIPNEPQPILRSSMIVNSLIEVNLFLELTFIIAVLKLY